MPTDQKLFINIIGISHADYMGRMLLMREIQATKLNGVINSNAVGFERIGSINSFFEGAPNFMLGGFEKLGMKGFSDAINQMLSVNESNNRLDMIDCMTRLTMVEMCKKEGIAHIQLDSPELLQEIDKERKRLGNELSEEKLIEYETRRIAAMVDNIAKLANLSPQKPNTFITVFVGAIHTPTLLVACKDHFDENHTKFSAATLLSTQAVEEYGQSHNDIKIIMKAFVARRLIAQKSKCTSEGQMQTYNQEVEKIMSAVAEIATIEVEQRDGSAYFSNQTFDQISTSAAQFLKAAPDKTPKAALSKSQEQDIFKQAAILIRKSDTKNLENLLNDNLWLVDYKDSGGNSLLHICTNSYALTSKDFGGINKDTGLCDRDVEVKQALDARGEVATLLISKGVNVNAQNNIRDKKTVAEGTGETAMEILTRIGTQEPDRANVDKEFAVNLLKKITDLIPKPAPTAAQNAALDTNKHQSHTQFII